MNEKDNNYKKMKNLKCKRMEMEKGKERERERKKGRRWNGKTQGGL